MLLVTVLSALLLIQLETRAALVVKPLLRAHPISPVESLVMMPLAHCLRVFTVLNFNTVFTFCVFFTQQ